MSVVIRKHRLLNTGLLRILILFKKQNLDALLHIWFEHNCHEMPLHIADTEYRKLHRGLNSFEFDTIYVKGLQKRQIIQEYIPHITEL